MWKEENIVLLNLFCTPQGIEKSFGGFKMCVNILLRLLCFVMVGKDVELKC